MKTLTVFTPTYNRAHTLGRVYDSLCRQTCKDFEWIIIDDGSTDNTKDLVESWVHSPIDFRYIYKENGGLHTGYNKAIEVMTTEICVCIDSDDYMPDDAVEFIVNYWGKHKDEKIVGIVGRDHFLNNKVIGGPLPNVEKAYLIELMDKYNHVGDKKVVMRVDLLKRIPAQPSYNNEKNFNPIYMMLQLDQFGKFRLVEKNLCFVDYQETGMAANIYKQYINSANSFCALRCLYIGLTHTTWRFKLKNLIHLGSSAHLANDLTWLKKCKYPMLAHFLYPLGYLLSLYILKKQNG